MGNYLSWQKSPVTKYGWKKDTYDVRDHYHNFTVSNVQNSIKHVDLRDQCPPIYDQGNLGSCTANAIAGAYEFDMMKEAEKDIFTPSRLFIYYNERKMEGHIDTDSGAEIRDGVKSINRVGVCPEKFWPYDISKFTDEPSVECYNDATHHKAIEYKRVPQNLEQLRQCIIEGYPFVFGIVVFESMETPQVAQTGIVPMPKPNEKILGGHAIMAVGFDNDKRQFLFRNSWGKEWGAEGYGFLPYDYLINSDIASDFWTIRRVVDNEVSIEPINEQKNEPEFKKDKKEVKWCDVIKEVETFKFTTNNPFVIPDDNEEDDDFDDECVQTNKEDHHSKKKNKGKRYKQKRKPKPQLSF